MSGPDAQAALQELADLLCQLPEPARTRADVLLDRVIRAEIARTVRKSGRLRNLVAARRIPPEQRTAELARVYEHCMLMPAFSARARRPLLAKLLGVSESRVREYQELLARFTLIPPPIEVETPRVRNRVEGAQRPLVRWGYQRNSPRDGRSKVARTYD